MKIQVGALPADPFPADGYTVVKTHTLTNTPDSLAPLNQQLDQYNLELTYSSPELRLKKKPKMNIFTFVAPAKDPNSEQWLTNYNEGLMIRYGAQRVPQGSFFTGETHDIALKNDKLESLLKADNTISSGDATVTPSWSWVGSVALPVGLINYAWQLWRTTSYGGLESNGWIAQGTNLSTDPSHLNRILQITPGEGGEY